MHGRMDVMSIEASAELPQNRASLAFCHKGPRVRELIEAAELTWVGF